jgi:polar amino acid transport system substrate-binding protein
MHTVRPLRRTLVTATAVTALAVSLVACSSSGGGSKPTSGAGGTTAGDAASGSVTLQIAKDTGAGGTSTSVQITEQPAIRKELPASYLSSNTLKIGVGALPQGFPPIAYDANDNKTLIGTDPDLARAIATVLGLKVQILNSTFDNLFVSIDSGKVDAGFSNVTDTEQRKEKYDFASYRQDNLGLAVKGSSSFTFDRSAAKPWDQLAGKTIATDAGTNQEKILLEWKKKLQAEGKNLTVKYFPDTNTAFSAIVSGKVDGYFTPNPSVAYEVGATKGTPRAIKDAGTYSGAGASLQGLIAATTKKGNGLAKPLSDAINYLIKGGQYATILKAYNDQQDSVPTSTVNPPGLPTSNS